MRPFTRSLFLALVAAGLAASSSVRAQMPEFGQPEQMKALASTDGDYDVAFSMMDPATGKMQENRCTATLTMILDGCAQRMDFEGSMMGMSYKGVGLTAYNRNTGKWQTSWADNFSASMSLYEGDMTDGKLVTYGTEMVQGKPMHYRNTTYNMTDHGFEWTMDSSEDGKTYTQWAHAVYTRKGSGKAVKKASGNDEGGW